MLNFLQSFLFSVIRIGTPLSLMAVCSTISQQAGLMNMAAESMMMSSALAGVLFSALAQNAWVGLLGAVLTSVAITLFLCFAAFIMKVDLYLMSISLNMALLGGTVFVLFLATGTKANTGNVPSISMGDWNIPLIRDIPFLGSIISGHNIFTYLTILMTFIVWFLLFKTKVGLRIRAVGQNPAAAESVGVNPRRIQTLAFVLAAIVGAFGGAFMSMGYMNMFTRDMTSGRGFIGLAASTIANAQPISAALIGLVFGLAYAVTNYLKLFIVDQWFLTALPFLLTVLIYLVMAAWRTFQAKHQLVVKRRKLAAMEAAHGGGADPSL